MKVKKKLNCILLVEDDEATNYFHKMVIDNSGIAETVHISYNGRDALDFLMAKAVGSSDGKNEYPQPDLILLDINMPRVNGWEFLEEYRKLKGNIKGQIVIVMLTTSFNPDDEVTATKTPEVSGFNYKPLNEKMLEDLIKQHFPDHIE